MQVLQPRTARRKPAFSPAPSPPKCAIAPKRADNPRKERRRRVRVFQDRAWMAFAEQPGRGWELVRPRQQIAPVLRDARRVGAEIVLHRRRA